MGVKSTVFLTRTEAVRKYADLKGRSKRRKYESRALTMDTRTLADEIERLNDEVNGGEGFENYSIEEDQS